MKKSLLFIFFVSLLLTSCQPKPKVVYLVPDANGTPGYSAKGADGVYENKAFVAAARQVRKNDVSDPLLSSLLEKDFVILSMTIENRSDSKVIYKPNYTALVNKVDYLKPLDYTDIYEIDWDAADRLRGRFFDLDVMLPPGGKATGLLIFRPISKDAWTAVLEVREFYIGTNTTAFSLPFKMKSNPS